jgi:hypothetical protein
MPEELFTTTGSGGPPPLLSCIFTPICPLPFTGNVSSERVYITKHGTEASMDTTRIGRVPLDPFQGVPTTPVEIVIKPPEVPPTAPREIVIERGVQMPPPPVGRPPAMEDALHAMHSGVLAFWRAVEEQSGLAAIVQGWGPDRQRAFLEQLIDLAPYTTQLAAEARQAYPHGSGPADEDDAQP